MTEKAKVPAIRFKFFTDDWEQRKVNELFKVTRGYVLAATITSEKRTEDAPYPVYSSQTKQNGLMGYYKEFLYEDAITWTTDGANAGTVNYRAGKFYCTNVCGVLLSNEIKANQMIAEALNNVAKKYVSYVGNPKLMNNVMADIEIQLPRQEEERELISNFFRKLDNLITLHQRKFEKLQNVKKAMLEKMFPKNGSNVPEIRFAGFTDAWEQRKLGDIIVKLTGGASIAPDDYQEEGVRTIPKGAVNSTGVADLSGSKKVTKQFFERNISSRISADNLVTSLRDLVPSAPNMGRIVRILVKQEDFLMPQGVYKIELNDRTDENFVIAYSNSERYRKIISSEKNGSTQVHIRNGEFLNIDISTPSYEEQTKIGTFFVSLDNLITLHQRKYEKLQNLKKACLEKMFV